MKTAMCHSLTNDLVLGFFGQDEYDLLVMTLRRIDKKLLSTVPLSSYTARWDSKQRAHRLAGQFKQGAPS